MLDMFWWGLFFVDPLAVEIRDLIGVVDSFDDVRVSLLSE